MLADNQNSDQSTRLFHPTLLLAHLNRHPQLGQTTGPVTDHT